MQPGKSPLEDGMPWMTFDAINFLKRILHNRMMVFEYGSGGSSVFFSQFVEKVFSVEHDKGWLKLVEEKIKQQQINNWTGLLREPGEIIGQLT